MTTTHPPLLQPTPSDPELAVAERQLAMLGELAELAMVAARAVSAWVVASTGAAERLLKEEYFVPEVGRACSCGCKDAANSFQKVSRALRLTLKLETATVAWARDLRNGVAPRKEKAAGDAGAPPAGAWVRTERQHPAGASAPERELGLDVDRPESERLFESERLDILHEGRFRDIVESIAADIGAAVDWATGAVGKAEHPRRDAQTLDFPCEPSPYAISDLRHPEPAFSP